MTLSMTIWGLIFNFIGSLILILVNLFGKWYGRNEINHWTKRFWWNGWRPIYRNTKTQKLVFMWNRYPVVEGFIPPKHKGNLAGFLFIAVGFLLQLIDAIK